MSCEIPQINVPQNVMENNNSTNKWEPVENSLNILMGWDGRFEHGRFLHGGSNIVMRSTVLLWDRSISIITEFTSNHITIVTVKVTVKVIVTVRSQSKSQSQVRASVIGYRSWVTAIVSGYL